MKNIVFILMDQLRFDYLSCYGADHLSTPNIDALAGEGVRYEQCISPSPLCVPARASLLTGKNSIANRVTENSRWLRPDHDAMGIHTWPKQLSDKGYYTKAIGKMHFYPWDIHEGFQERIIAEDKRHFRVKDDYELFLEKHGYHRRHGDTFEGYFEHKGAIINTLPEAMQIDRYVADRTCDVVDGLDKEKPFALMIGFPGPHCPYDPMQKDYDALEGNTMPEPYPETEESMSFRELFIRNNKYPWNKVDYTGFTREQKLKIRRHYSGLIQRLDTHIGEIVDSLKAKGLYEDTVIIVSSDHGDLMGDFSLLAKHFFYEGSIRVPLIIKSPGQAPGVHKEVVSLTDLYATILKWADIEREDTVDSTVLRPFGESTGRAPIFGATDIGWMIRDDSYKYCIHNNETELFFDVQADPMEQDNLVDVPEQAARKGMMKKMLYGRLFAALDEANKDLVVTAPGLDAGFFDRGWTRPYPYIETSHT